MLLGQHTPTQVPCVVLRHLLLLLVLCMGCVHAFHPYDPLDPTAEKPRPYFVPYDLGFVGASEAAENPVGTLANPGNQFTRSQPNILAGVHARRTCELVEQPGLIAGDLAALSATRCVDSHLDGTPCLLSPWQLHRNMPCHAPAYRWPVLLHPC